MKKMISLALAALMLLSLSVSALAGEADSDMDYVKDKGVLVVGITEYEPMDYLDEDGQWIGFDADMAKAFAAYLGVDVEFQEITWDYKLMELDTKAIDVVWNGMTLTDEVLEGMECSVPYVENAQTVVVPADKADQFTAPEDLEGLVFAVEEGSAGEDEVQALDCDYNAMPTQADALLEVRAGYSDAAVIDLVMAEAMVGEDTDYADLAAVMDLNSEQYGVGFRKGSDLCQALNEFFLASYEDGTMQAVADTYGVALMDQTALAAEAAEDAAAESAQ